MFRGLVKLYQSHLVFKGLLEARGYCRKVNGRAAKGASAMKLKLADSEYWLAGNAGVPAGVDHSRQ